MGVELLALRPIFKGEEAKMDKKNVPFQRKQTQKVIEILGSPTLERWPHFLNIRLFWGLKSCTPNLEKWYHINGVSNPRGFQLLSSLLEYEPAKRISANDALLHPYNTESPKVT